MFAFQILIITAHQFTSTCMLRHLWPADSSKKNKGMTHRLMAVGTRGAAVVILRPFSEKFYP
jgi:hypothetical protein